MYGSFGRTQDGQDYWIGYGRDAMRMARECAAKCEAKGMWRKMMAWERLWVAHSLDPTKPLRCNLPPGAVRYERQSRGIFGPPAATMFDDGRGSTRPKTWEI
jgi:hypothetical protein